MKGKRLEQPLHVPDDPSHAFRGAELPLGEIDDAGPAPRNALAPISNGLSRETFGEPLSDERFSGTWVHGALTSTSGTEPSSRQIEHFVPVVRLNMHHIVALG
jgi:hypothetical protein